MAKYYKSYSNYIKKEQHSTTKDGSQILVNDSPTTTQKTGLIDGQIYTATPGGSIFIVDPGFYRPKTYNTEGWSLNTFTLSGLSSTNKFLFDLESTNQDVIQKYVKLNKRYTNISDFCYFGSSNMMLKAAVDDIIMRFPAGLYIENADPISTGSKNITVSVIVSGDTYLQNKFAIDLTQKQNDSINGPYDLRSMSSSYFDYEVIDNNEQVIADVTGFTGHTQSTYNVTFGLTNIYTGSTKLTIRPKETKIEQFFQSLDDFQSFLLNRYSNPKYSNKIRVPRETEDGIEFEAKMLTWPTSDGYNIDIDTADYLIYMNTLIETTNYLDEMYSDITYRLLTHSSIKNLDASYLVDISPLDVEDIVFGGTKIQSIIRLYGRNFDEVKKYIDNISNANKITYDEYDNLPSEYLPSRANTSGWDVFTLDSKYINTGTTNENLYPNISKAYNSKEISNIFLKNLIINSNYIHRSKGTKKSVRKILGLLGFDSDWYEIREYIHKADDYITGSSLENIAKLNYNRLNTGSTSSNYVYGPYNDLFRDTTVGFFVKCPHCDSENYTNPYSENENLVIGSFSGITNNNYLIASYNMSEPWVSGETYTVTISGDLQSGQKFVVYSGSDNSNFAFDDLEYDSNTKLWTATNSVTYLSGDTKIVNVYNSPSGSTTGTINWIKVEKGSQSTQWIPNDDDNEYNSYYGVCVENGHVFKIVSGMTGYPNVSKNTESFYFQQKGNWYRETGGENTDLSGNTYVNEIYHGNNPHIGDGNYDNGYDYISQFRDIFKRYIRSFNESISGNTLYLNKGFSLPSKKIYDDNKIAYFNNSDDKLFLNLKNLAIGIDGNKVLQSFFHKNNKIETTSNSTVNIHSGSTEYILITSTGSTNVITGNLNIGQKVKIHHSTGSTGVVYYTGSTQITGDTLKKGNTILVYNNTGTTITEKYNGEDEFDFLKKLALPYLEQVIPSTALFDFLLMVNGKPKWLLVDEYCEINEDIGSFNGNHIIVYQNVNYFDMTSNGLQGDPDLLKMINLQFGDGYIFYKTIASEIYLKSDDDNYITMENESYSIEETEISDGYDNLYFFRKKNDNCPINKEFIHE